MSFNYAIQIALIALVALSILFMIFRYSRRLLATFMTTVVPMFMIYMFFEIFTSSPIFYSTIKTAGTMLQDASSDVFMPTLQDAPQDMPQPIRPAIAQLAYYAGEAMNHWATSKAQPQTPTSASKDTSQNHNHDHDHATARRDWAGDLFAAGKKWWEGEGHEGHKGG